MVSRGFVNVHNDQFVYIKYVHFLHSNYISIKLLKYLLSNLKFRQKDTDCKILQNNNQMKKSQMNSTTHLISCSLRGYRKHTVSRLKVLSSNFDFDTIINFSTNSFLPPLSSLRPPTPTPRSVPYLSYHIPQNQVLLQVKEK